MRSTLRVMMIGDSVMADAELGIARALSATGEATSFPNTMVAFGLTTHRNWPTVFPYLIRTERPQLIIGTWSWDFGGPTTPNALHQPKQYAALMEGFLRTLLAPGDGVDGVMLLEFLPGGVVAGATPAVLAHHKGRGRWKRRLGCHCRTDAGRLSRKSDVPALGRLDSARRSLLNLAPPDGGPWWSEGSMGARAQARRYAPVPPRKCPPRPGDHGGPQFADQAGTAERAVVRRAMDDEP